MTNTLEKVLNKDLNEKLAKEDFNKKAKQQQLELSISYCLDNLYLYLPTFIKSAFSQINSSNKDNPNIYICSTFSDEIHDKIKYYFNAIGLT